MQLKRKRDDDMDAITQKRHTELMEALQEQSKLLRELCSVTSAQGTRASGESDPGRVELGDNGDSGEDGGTEDERGSDDASSD